MLPICGACWNRVHAARLTALARQFPAVLILGPRQVGKTTLARAAFSKAPYLDLEQPGTRQLFAADPLFQIESRLPGRTGALVLDEVQCVPEVFAALRGLIDRDRRRRGRFILLGSAQATLIRQVSESLAGRVGILELDPLTVAEVAPGTLDEVRNHPVHGASWETFVLEDIIRREKVRHPHAQFFFWRTADGAEIDLVIERGTQRVAVEIKAWRGDTIHAARVLERAMSDVGAKTGWILDPGRRR